MGRCTATGTHTIDLEEKGGWCTLLYALLDRRWRGKAAVVGAGGRQRGNFARGLTLSVSHHLSKQFYHTNIHWRSDRLILTQSILPGRKWKNDNEALISPSLQIMKISKSWSYTINPACCSEICIQEDLRTLQVILISEGIVWKGERKLT